MWFLAPENDYRALERAPLPELHLRVAVCIPVYNRVDLLARTVAALVPQSYPRHLLEVRIGDDGSEEDVAAAVAPFRDRLQITVHRRERDGYGAGQARNLAARSTDADILVFIDADCLPDVDLVLRHAEWHHKAANLVVVGSRHGLDTSRHGIDELAAGEAPLRTEAFGTETPERTHVEQTDHRRILHRRTGGQRRGDEAFRSLVSSNFSMRRDRFLEVGGFDETFHRWGGEDVELGWRCHVGGLFTVVEDGAVTFHQLQEDLWEDEGRERSKALNAGVIQNKIPHAFYRKYVPGHFWEVPKVSVVVLPTIQERIEELIEQMRRQNHTDWELVFHGTTPEVIFFGEMNKSHPRLEVVESTDPLDVVRAAGGEYLAVVHGDAALEPRLISRLVRRLEQQRRASAARSAYLVDGVVVRRRGDRRRIDEAWDTAAWGLPFFHMARRREWSKALHGAANIADAFATVDELSSTIDVGEAFVGVRSPSPGPEVGQPHPSFIAPSTQLHRDIARTGKGPAALPAVARYLRANYQPEVETVPPREEPPASRDESPKADKPTIRYVGWTGYDNMGDEALLQAITAALPWGEMRTSRRGDLLLLGGGTLINRGSYLAWLEEQDSPRIERAVFGTGVANPQFWGDREDTARWVDWLETCAYVGVRGPLSAEVLDSWGVRTEVEVVGDAALLLEPAAPRRDGLVVVAPCRTRGELWGEGDDAVYRRLAELVEHLIAKGHEVHLLASHPDDDGPCLQIMRAADRPELPYLAGYEDLETAMSLLASADLVVAERLHAAVIAAAGGTPFVALEYRPKLRDFARSVGYEEYTLRTDDLDRLEEVAGSALDNLPRLRTELVPVVEGYRVRLRAAADRLREVMET